MIRPMIAGDLPQIKAIIDATELFPSEMLDDMTADYFAKSGDDLWFAFVKDDTVIGVAYSQPEQMTQGTWNMRALAVTPDQQGTGAGKALINHTRDHLKMHDGRLLLIETADIDDFAGQRAFYERCGLSQVAHIHDYYEHGVGKVTFAQQLNS